MAEAGRSAASGARAAKGPASPPAWVLEELPAKEAWLRRCRLRVHPEAGAGLEMEASELGYLVEDVAANPGQDPAMKRGDVLVEIAGRRLFGLPAAADVEAAFSEAFADGAEVLLVDADELREALINRDSNEECPCEVPEGDGEYERIVPPGESANYELLRRAESSVEYDAVVHIPVGRGTVWSLGPEPMAYLTDDLTRLGSEYGLTAEAKLDRAGNMESVALRGLSTAIAAARPTVVQILDHYRQGKWQASGETAHVGAGGAAAGDDAALVGGAAVDGLGFRVPDHVKDIRQFKYHDHTADIIVHSWGATRAEAFGQVVAGMFNYMTDLENVDLRSAVEVEATGHDLLDLLYHLLDEFLFIFGTEMHVSRCIDIVEFDEQQLRIRARGYGEKMNLKKHEQGTEIKAITMHMMRILAPDVVMTEEGTRPRAAAGEDDSEPIPGYPHEVYVLLDI
eukprot:CAMPEP_0176096068 /NCGR_PEP_ID=MMETSP0120_2-20121206/48159_1 /TAXON_ID=160619 /ORGANISM="Kryptoperidinium foliaceum, Strain CCMP 1326" /LENGTH=453 /DNA_ID=CAMNT_0017430051 /DNA_START=27 /DNA_END=1388 /DNA_ORIENTATION=-